MRRAMLVSALALGACQSQTMERDQMGLWKSAEQIRRQQEATPENAAEAEAARAAAESPKKKITIPPDVHAQMDEFVARKSTIFADIVEVDLSSAWWFALATFSISRDAVIRRDEQDAARGVRTIILQRIPTVAATMESVPTVRFGEGMRIVGVDRITLRFWDRLSDERPVWFHALGTGKSAFFKVDGEPPQESRGKSVDVRSEVHLAGDAYRYDSSAEAKP